MTLLATHEIDDLAGQLYLSRMCDGASPIPVAEYRGTWHTWTYPALRPDARRHFGRQAAGFRLLAQRHMLLHSVAPGAALR